MNTEIVMRLKLIAARATALAYDLEHGKLWDGELDSGLSEISREMNASIKARDRDRADGGR